MQDLVENILPVIVVGGIKVVNTFNFLLSTDNSLVEGNKHLKSGVSLLSWHNLACEKKNFANLKTQTNFVWHLINESLTYHNYRKMTGGRKDFR